MISACGCVFGDFYVCLFSSVSECFRDEQVPHIQSLSILFTLLVSQNIRGGRLRAFAFAGLESLCCFNPSLDRLINFSVFFTWLFWTLEMDCQLFVSVCNLLFRVITPQVNDDNSKACFSKHSQWPPKSFRHRLARELMLLHSSLDV
ncbi:hypothetical protein TorRG33x02_206630 [Trema orientale]|uniref:Uncharacterized protein n=1 Tax=Trema orientale TaxID=63057 RepID=A0A2P5ED92_TREOI|nr:hypothetical protein TorRG33x02_206630 [Trema orientale]